VFVLAYTAVRVGELLRDPNDPRRRGVRWEDLSLDDGSMDVYRKKQQWDAASLPDPAISPLRSYRQLMDPPTERWPVFPTFDQRTLAGLIQNELLIEGNARKQLLNAVRSTLATYCWHLMRIFSRRRSRQTAHGRFSSYSQKPQRSTSTIRNTIILLHTAAVVEWVRSSFARLGIQSRLDISIIRRRWFVSATRILKLAS